MTSRWQRKQAILAAERAKAAAELAAARRLAAEKDATNPRRVGAKLAVLAAQVWTEPLGSSLMGVLLAAGLAFPKEQIVDLPGVIQ